MKGKKRSLVRKLAVTGLVVMLVLMAATYVGLAMFFEDHYYYGTTINGVDMSYKTPVEAEALLYEKLYGYSLEMTGREQMRDMILPAEIEMEYRLGDSLVEVKRQQRPGLWFTGFSGNCVYELPGVVEYNEELLEQKIDRLTFFRTENIRAPSDAYLAYVPERQECMVVESNPGTQIVRERARQAIGDALGRMEEALDLEEAGCYAYDMQESGSHELQEALAVANRYVAASITYDWNGNEVVVDGDKVWEWIHIVGEQVTLDEAGIGEFVSEQARLYDTYGKNRIFLTTDGRQIDLKSAAFGWKTDQEAETKALIKSVKNGETVKKQPAYVYTAPESGQKDIGSSYVEIDLSNQHLYLYVDGELIVESDIVSGNASRGWNTPAGVFGLTYKTRNAVLRGEGYATPVSYWMPFNGNIGMHDATWRSSFGGDIYLTNGSHGCINLPYENAKIIYEYMYDGFPVVCYY